MEKGYHCDKCEGTSTTSTVCENPDCPNQPCCSKPLAECRCGLKNISELTNISEGLLYKETCFALLPKKVEGKWIWFKFYTEIRKVTKIYIAFFALVDSEWDSELIERKLFE